MTARTEMFGDGVAAQIYPASTITECASRPIVPQYAEHADEADPLEGMGSLGTGLVIAGSVVALAVCGAVGTLSDGVRRFRTESRAHVRRDTDMTDPVAGQYDGEPTPQRPIMGAAGMELVVAVREALKNRRAR